MRETDRERAGRGGGEHGENAGHGREPYEGPWFARGLERAYRPRPELGAPRRRRGAPAERRRPWEGRAGPAAEYGREYGRWRAPRGEAGYGGEYERWGAERRGGPYGRGPRRRPAGAAPGRRPGRRPGAWRRWRTVPAWQVPRGAPARERWWHAIGPERRQDYDWAYGAREPERYGWTGETGRDGGPDAPRRRRRRRR